MEYTKLQLREKVKSDLPRIVEYVNGALKGHGVADIEENLIRLARDSKPPHWLEQLKRDGTLPNSDGKTIGSIIEMLLIAVLEKWILKEFGIGKMAISPARGVDFPDLDLGLKSPSSNFCTSEPFFSPYERLIGSHFDALVLLTDYQEKKKQNPLRLQIIKSRYLRKTQIADTNLCKIARNQRMWLLKNGEPWAKRCFRFLAYVNGSDWQCQRIKDLLSIALTDEQKIDHKIGTFAKHYSLANKKREARGEEIIPESDLRALQRIRTMTPRAVGILDAADNWVAETHKEFARMPNDSEWRNLRDGPLDGAIGMSYALQWRYNFRKIFK